MTNQTAAGRDLTPAEQKAVDTWRGRRKSPRIKAHGKDDGVITIGTDHPDAATGIALLMEAIGTKEEPFLAGLMTDLVNVGSKGHDVDEAGEAKANFLLSVVKGIEPSDEVEAMLAAQMAAVHSATMTFARRLNHVDTLPQQDSAERAFNKMARTFAAQVEALKRYRSRGEQTVRVEHVTVNEGGQAIVGNVSNGEGRDVKKTGH
jgi:hypothetical protein